MNNIPDPSREFAPGQIVFLKANPSTRGAVVEFDEAMVKADITAEPVAYGVLEVK